MIGTRDREILSRIEFESDISVGEIARSSRVKPATVNYALRKLHDKGVLSRRCFINPYRLGYIEMAMYFSLIDQGPKERDRLVQKLVENDHVIHLGSLLGDYHFIVIFLCKSLGDVNTFIHDAFLGAGDIFSDKLIAPRTSISYYHRKYLNPASQRSTGVTLTTNGEAQFVPDETDKKLLYTLGTIEFESLRKLAQKLGLPFSTVERRVKKLQEAGVLSGFFYQASPSKLGVHCYRLLVSKKGFCTGTEAKLNEFCRDHPQIIYLVESIGAWDYEIGVEAHSSDIVTSLVEELYGLCGMRIASVKVLMEVTDYKCCHYPVQP